MNAFSSIGKYRGNAAVRRVRSRAYRAGLREGFGATGLFWLPAAHHHLSGIDSSISGAWKAVGDAIKAASEQKVKQLGKTPDITEPAE